MIIDFHTHVFPPQIKQNRRKYIEADPCFALLYSQKDTRLATADELVASMDKAVTRNNHSKAVVDYALHDLMGKALCVPLYKLLGGRSNEKIRLA